MHTRNHTGWLSAALVLGFAAGCGDDGPTGLEPPLIESRDASAAECPNGGTVLSSGFDANGNGTLQADEVLESTTVCAPDPGPDGNGGGDGKNALVSIAAEPEGANCTFGGQRVDTGLDEDGDGVLDPEEVEQTTYVCDGAPGPNGLSYLVRTSTVVDEACEGGGLRIEAGLDRDEDDVLDDDEVEFTTDICASVDGADALLDIDAEAAGPNCAAGGQRIRRGFDRDRSGTLDPNEVEATDYLCSPVATLVLTSSIAPGSDCSNGGLRIDSGLDVDANGLLAASEVTTTRFLCNGDDGGVALTRTATVGAGSPPCLAGGLRIESGVDLDLDGTLSPSEVDATTYACDAVPGAAGRDGNAVRVSPEAPGTNCARGGTLIETGPDANGDGQLQDSEVTESRFVCDGTDAAALVAIEAIDPGPICLNGGQRILEGADLDGDGMLSTPEITSSTEVCSARPSLPILIISAGLGNGYRGAPYSETLTAAGGFGGNFQWSVGSGALPPGLSLDTSGTPDTRLSGTPTSTGSFAFEVLVTDGFGAVDAKSYTVAIQPPPCEPGVGGVVGETRTTISVLTSFSTGTTDIEVDTSTAGWIYVADSGSSIERHRKDGSVEEDVDALLTGVSGADINSVHIEGGSIYVTSDTTICSSDCIWRISDDEGATFNVVSLATFSPSTNEMLQGVEVIGTTLYAITNGSADAQFWSIDLSGSFPVAATLLATLSTIDTCNGLASDSTYFYTVCDDNGSGAEGLVRIDRTTLTPERVVDLDLGIATGSWAELDVVDLDQDGIADVAYVQGDNNGSTTDPEGGTFYVCNPGGGVPAFASPFGTGTPDDEGMAYDPATNSLWLLQEGSTNLFRFD